MISCKLHLIPVFGQSRRLRHDSGIGEKDVQTGTGRDDLVCGGVDGGEACEVARNESDGGAGREFMGSLYGGGGRGGIAARENDMAWVVLG